MNEATFKTWEELTRREQLVSMISDDYKSLHGFRPRFDWATWSEEELENYHRSIQDDLMAEVAREQEEQGFIVDADRPEVFEHKPFTIGDVVKITL